MVGARGGIRVQIGDRDRISGESESFMVRHLSSGAATAAPLPRPSSLPPPHAACFTSARLREHGITAPTSPDIANLRRRGRRARPSISLLELEPCELVVTHPTLSSWPVANLFIAPKLIRKLAHHRISPPLIILGQKIHMG